MSSIHATFVTEGPIGMSSGTKTLPEPVLTQYTDAIWRHKVTLIYSDIYKRMASALGREK